MNKYLHKRAGERERRRQTAVYLERRQAKICKAWPISFFTSTLSLSLSFFGSQILCASARTEWRKKKQDSFVYPGGFLSLFPSLFLLLLVLLLNRSFVFKISKCTRLLGDYFNSMWEKQFLTIYLYFIWSNQLVMRLLLISRARTHAYNTNFYHIDFIGC